MPELICNLLSGFVVPIPTFPLSHILTFSVKEVPVCVSNVKSELILVPLDIALIFELGPHSFDRLNPSEHEVPVAPCLEFIKLKAHNSVGPPESPLKIATDEQLLNPVVLVP